MHHFRYSAQSLHCESVDLAEIARLYGTPTYVYSAQTMADNYTRLAGSLSGLDLQLCYALKANSNIAIIRNFANLGSGFDVVSLGEMKREIAEITARHTGQSVETITADADRDHWFTAEEARAYGLVDHVTHR